MKRIGGSVCRIVFGGLFLAAAIAVAIFAESEFLLVSAVILINAILCLVSGIVNVVKINAANNELRLQNEQNTADSAASQADDADQYTQARS